MAVVPAAPTIDVGVSDTTELNQFRDTIRYLLDKPAFTLKADANQSLTSATYTSLTLVVEDLDDDPDGVGGHDTATNTSRFTARYAGWYNVCGVATFATNVTGTRIVRLAVNATPLDGALVSVATGALPVAITTPSFRLYLNVGDYVEVQGWQNSGGALNTGFSSGYVPSLSGEWCRLT